MENISEYRYAGFWARVLASLIDTVLLLLLLFPLMTWLFGMDYWFGHSKPHWLMDSLLNYGLPALGWLAFWVSKSATPGKLWLGMKIIDEKTGGKPNAAQFIVRYLGYYLSMLAVFLGFIWVGIDKRKQGWHDKIAGTLVVYQSAESSEEFI